MSTDIRPLIGIAATRPLTGTEAETAFAALFDGAATPAQIGGLLMALRVRGETVATVVGDAGQPLHVAGTSGRHFGGLQVLRRRHQWLAIDGRGETPPAFSPPSHLAGPVGPVDPVERPVQHLRGLGLRVEDFDQVP